MTRQARTSMTLKDQAQLVDRGGKEVGGSEYASVNDVRLADVFRSLGYFKDSSAEEQHELKAAAALTLMGINPQDDIEGMLACQIVGCHAAAMVCYRRAMHYDLSVEAREHQLRYAAKLSRTYLLQIEALQRYRGKGQQKVTVEHIHVHAGANAIVGDVHRGGAEIKSEEQPHAKQIKQAADALMPTVRRTNEAGEPLPITGDAEREMPNARRSFNRRSKR